MLWRRTPPGVRELKLPRSRKILQRQSRTPPGVRELKLTKGTNIAEKLCRTPPGVRELKLSPMFGDTLYPYVAPLLGCVN